MKHRLIRFRRAAVSCIAVATALTGLSVLGLSTVASASPATWTSAITAAGAPNIARTGSTQGAGNLVVGVAAGNTFAAGQSFTITVTTAGVVFANTPAAASATPDLCAPAPNNCTVTGGGTSVITVTLNGLGGPATGAEAITISNIFYTTTAAAVGALTLASSTGDGAPAANATVVANNITALGSTGSTITGATQPYIAPTSINQAGGNLVVTFMAGSTWTAGGSFKIYLYDHVGAANITWDHIPTVTLTTGAGDTAMCTSTAPVCAPTVAANTLTVNLNNVTGQVGIPTTESLTISNIGLTTAGSATGFILVNSNLGAVAATTGFTTGPQAANAIVATAPGQIFIALHTFQIKPGTTTPAGDWAVALFGQNTSWVAGDKMYFTIANNNTTNCESVGTPDTVGFSGTPAVVVTNATNGATTVPTFTTALASATGSSCASLSGVNNEVVLTFTNSGSITSSTAPGAILGGAPAPITIVLANISLAVSADVGATGSCGTVGNITATEGYNTAPVFVPGPTCATGVANDALNTGASDTTSDLAFGGTPQTGFPGGPSNANIQFVVVTVTANAPSTTLQYNFSSSGGEVVNQAVSPITIGEGSPGSLSTGVTGWACLALSPAAAVGAAAEWSAVPTVTATGGGLTVGNVGLLTPGGQTGPTELVFQVTGASTVTPGTVTISAITLNTPAYQGFTLIGAFWFRANSAADACAGANSAGGAGPAPSGIPYFNNMTALNTFTVANIAGRTFGFSADDTAAQEFISMGCSTGHDLAGTTTPQVGVVAATDATFNDAEAGSFLAGALPGPGPVRPIGAAASEENNFGVDTAGNVTGPAARGTGILVTPTNVLSPSFLLALKITGTTDVYALGGSLAFGQQNITALQSTPVYNCDGSVHVNPTNGTTQFLTVHWIFGQTADDTAQQAGDFLGPAAVGTAHFQGAYSSGASSYNDTPGMSSTAPSTAPDTNVSTCIVVWDGGFQDAASAGAMAANGGSQPTTAGYGPAGNGLGFPVFATSQAGLSIGAQTGLTNDACRQVINVGGPAVLSDNILTQEQGLGMSAIRIAGIDYTDTSQLTAKFELTSSDLTFKPSGLDWDPAGAPAGVAPGNPGGFYAIVARGDFYTDAFTAAGISHYSLSGNVVNTGFLPVLLTWDTSNTHNPGGTNYLGGFLQQVGQSYFDFVDPPLPSTSFTINNLWLIGGTFAITPSLENTIVSDLNTKGTPA